jgi:acyl phosphate:glycerol-3-phosphate acyltransferase
VSSAAAVYNTAMDRMPLLLGLTLLAYLLGSVPFGLLVGKARGVDVRKAGSGNIGATNVARLLGVRFFFIVFTLDLLKGLVPVLIAGLLLASYRPLGMLDYMLWLGVGCAAILGHMFSVFLGFHGGKGVATSAGVILGVFPYFTLPALGAVALWIVLFKLTRYISVASIVAAAAFPVLFLVFGLIQNRPVFEDQLVLLLFGVMMAVLVIVRHRSNIARLRAGTEPRAARTMT